MVNTDMALIEVVKYNGNNSDFVWKFPTEDLKLGAQLIVNNAQSAFFVKNGVVLDEFTEGRYTLKSGNIPWLNKLINLPFGGNSPFAAEVWYVNQVTKLDNRWGTLQPINLEDPLYNVIVPVRAFGQYGFRIIDSRAFLTTIVGTAKLFNSLQITEYFTGKVLSSITTALSKAVIKDKISLLQVGAYQDALSDYCEKEINKEFIKYGIEIVNFFFVSINIPEDDPSFIKLKEAKEFAMRINVIGKDMYQMDRTFDVLDKTAENTGAGSFTSAGLGLGAGLGMGGIFKNQFSGMGGVMSNVSETPPPPLVSNLFYFVIGGKQSAPFSIEETKVLIDNNTINEDTRVWVKGLNEWLPAKDLDLLKHLFTDSPPPIPEG
jgi:membrane protease subunit (stomatin/prohibitin family)